MSMGIVRPDGSIDWNISEPARPSPAAEVRRDRDMARRRDQSEAPTIRVVDEALVFPDGSRADLPLISNHALIAAPLPKSDIAQALLEMIASRLDHIQRIEAALANKRVEVEHSPLLQLRGAEWVWLAGTAVRCLRLPDYRFMEEDELPWPNQRSPYRDGGAKMRVAAGRKLDRRLRSRARRVIDDYRNDIAWFRSELQEAWEGTHHAMHWRVVGWFYREDHLAYERKLSIEEDREYGADLMGFDTTEGRVVSRSAGGPERQSPASMQYVSRLPRDR